MAFRASAATSALLRPFTYWTSHRCQHSATVFDKMIQLTVVGLDGKRHLIRGLEGQSLANVLHANYEVLGEEAIGLSPEGRGAIEAHVMIPSEYLVSLPSPDVTDTRIMEQLTPSYRANSRLASRIILSKALDQMVIALGNIYPWKSL